MQSQSSSSNVSSGPYQVNDLGQITLPSVPQFPDLQRDADSTCLYDCHMD